MDIASTSLSPTSTTDSPKIKAVEHQTDTTVKRKRVETKPKSGKRKRAVIECSECNNVFKQRRDLARHQKKAVSHNCEKCEKKFCNRYDLEKHIRAEHIVANDEPDNKVNEPICPETGHESMEGYLNEKQNKMHLIRSSARKSPWYAVVNRELNPNFTYNNLRELLKEVTMDIVTAYKINLSFGTMLYHVADEQYRYFYASNNSTLFQLPHLVVNNDDFNNFFKKILAMDLLETYFRHRPTSGWTLAGLPNVEIRYYLLRDVPLGISSEPYKTPNPKVEITDYDDESDVSDDEEYYFNLQDYDDESDGYF